MFSILRMDDTKQEVTMKKIFGLILLATINYSIFADTIECVSLVKNDALTLDLHKSGAFENCFLLDNVAQNTTLQFAVLSTDKVQNKISLYDVAAGGSATYISEYNSNADAVNIFSINTTDRTISFKITPLTHLNTDKNISITYMEINSVAYVVIDLSDIVPNVPIPPPTPPGENDEDCSYRFGVRVCNEIN